MTDKSIGAKIRDSQKSDHDLRADRPLKGVAVRRRHQPIFNEVDEDLLKNPKAKRCYF